jgi:hypothetical protein
MQNNKAFEVEYNIEKLAEQANIENKPGYNLSIIDNVRLKDTKHTLKKIDIILLLFTLLSQIYQGNLLQLLLLMDQLKLLRDQELYH